MFVGLGWGVASGNKLGTRLLEGVSAMYPEKGDEWMYSGQYIKGLILPRQLKGLLSEVLINHLRMLVVNLCMFV